MHSVNKMYYCVVGMDQSILMVLIVFRSTYGKQRGLFDVFSSFHLNLNGGKRICSGSIFRKSKLKTQNIMFNLSVP